MPKYAVARDNPPHSIVAFITNNGEDFPEGFVCAEVSPEAIQDGSVAIGMAIDPDTHTIVAAPAKSEFLARDLIDLLTPDDLAAIETAVAGNAALRLLWLRLCSRGDKPVPTGSEAFQQGWAGLTAALPVGRADDLATALGI